MWQDRLKLYLCHGFYIHSGEAGHALRSERVEAVSARQLVAPSAVTRAEYERPSKLAIRGEKQGCAFAFAEQGSRIVHGIATSRSRKAQLWRSLVDSAVDPAAWTEED